MQERSPKLVATIVWAALVVGVVMFLGVAFVVRFPGDPKLAGTLLPVAGGLSVVGTAISWLWAIRMRPKLPKGATPHAPEQLAVTRLIAASALCEGPALFSIVGFLVTGEGVLLLPFALSFVSLLAHFPDARHWERLTRAPAAEGAPRSNPLIRG